MEYAPTQFISGIFKADGFDGIIYSSLLKAGGVNIALFDPGTRRTGQYGRDLLRRERELLGPKGARQAGERANRTGRTKARTKVDRVRRHKPEESCECKSRTR